jgi:hypothetical protein
MRMRKEKKRRRLGNGWWRRPAGERSRFRMNEWTFRLHLFSFWFQQHSLSLSFRWPNFDFLFSWGECESIWIWGQRRHTTQNETAKNETVVVESTKRKLCR